MYLAETAGLETAERFLFAARATFDDLAEHPKLGTALHARNPKLAGMRKWFAITAAMGAIFLGGQVYEYLSLGYGLTTNLFSNCFYLMTGFHGAHVFIGLLLILGVLWRSRRQGHYNDVTHVGPEMAEVYWHFVDVVWIVLFTLIYILTLF